MGGASIMVINASYSVSKVPIEYQSGSWDFL